MVETIMKELEKWVLTHYQSILLALITLLVGLWLIKWVARAAKKAMEIRDMDQTLRTFFGDLISVSLKAVLFISVAGILGIQTTSFVAILGAAGLAVGLALQGSLGNFAGGVLILIFRPFKVGDLIEAQGYTGHVTALNIFVTTLKTPDSKAVILPNGPLSNGSITNYTTINQLRVDLTVGVSYKTDIQLARAVIIEAMLKNPKVLRTPEPSVSVSELGDSSVVLAVRPYATVDDYWDVYFGTLEDVRNALDKAGIEIPFPQRVVHHLNETE
ncbi:MAG: mechanosensitive ion channel [Bacteroidia bacterium]|nr:mechanosensitive ion channel [Bacteroidia bacterium]